MRSFWNATWKSFPAIYLDCPRKIFFPMKNLSISSVTKNFVFLITIAYNTLNTNKSSLFYKDMKSKGNPMFEVKFGTSEPVFHNEYWVVNGEVFEIEIDASSGPLYSKGKKSHTR